MINLRVPLVIAGIALASLLEARGQEYASVHDAASEMVTYTRQGRYEEAVQTGRSALKHQPNDEFIYQQIADVYLIRAQKDPAQRGQWISNAISYTDKALSLNSKDDDAAGVNLFQIARGYEYAGDLSVGDRCGYYAKARKLLEDREPLLKGDHITLNGKALPLSPLRAENERVMSELTAKAGKANCK